MTFEAFRQSLSRTTAPDGLPPALLALWHDGRGDWEAAHGVAQDISDLVGSRIHAYLHRKEGDQFNADYWYRRAGIRRFDGTLAQEWEAIAQDLLGAWPPTA